MDHLPQQRISHCRLYLKRRTLEDTMRCQGHHRQSSELPNMLNNLDVVGNIKAAQAVYSGTLILDLESGRQRLEASVRRWCAPIYLFKSSRKDIGGDGVSLWANDSGGNAFAQSWGPAGHPQRRRKCLLDVPKFTDVANGHLACDDEG